MTDFTKIKSKYVKNKIKNLQKNANNMKYIADLMRIELLAKGQTFGLPTGYIRNSLKEKYPKEWDAIGKELNPKHVTLKQEKGKEIKETKNAKEELKKMEQKEKIESEKTWKKARGR